MAKKTSTKSKTSSSKTPSPKPNTAKTVSSKTSPSKPGSSKPSPSKSSSKPKAASAGRSSAKPSSVASATTGKPKSSATASKPKAAGVKADKPKSAKAAFQQSKPVEAEVNRFKVSFGQNDSVADREPLSEEELRKIKSGLSKKDLANFRELLMEKRAELIGDVESLKADAKSAGASISYEHMADTGSDNYEQEFTLGLVESERQMLHEINEALVRIDKGIYGICIILGKPIDRARLEAKPWAKYCIEVAREKERRQAPRFRA